MGLTIHYRLAFTPIGGWSFQATDARQAVEEARGIALKMKQQKAFDAVGPMRWDDECRRWNREFYEFPVSGHSNRHHLIEPLPAEGSLFEIRPGRDCEPLWIGLCRYPKTHSAYGRKFHVPHGPEWRLRRFSKTQYASLHGWEHFRRCHVAIVDFLAALRPLRFDVEISDEGRYWPDRSEQNLREEVGMMNRLVAAGAGAIKDACDDGSVQAPIFAHPQFERLEAEGTNLLAKRP